MKKFALILAGSGVFDGSEIHEVTLSMLAIMQQGGTYQCFAPDIDQHHVLNHITGEEMNETRNVLIESARISRGNIKNINEFKAEDFDVLMIPGGFGVAKNLCDFAFKGADCSVHPEVEKVVMEMKDAGKPIAALCISPVIISKLFGDVELTLGQDEGTIKHVEKLGSRHVKTTHGEVIVDKKYKVYTTPCYMLDANIVEIYQGATNVVKAILKDLGSKI
jgi:enhancing lycopene biosynthesis protein 2